MRGFLGRFRLRLTGDPLRRRGLAVAAVAFACDGVAVAAFGVAMLALIVGSILTAGLVASLISKSHEQ